MAKKFFFLRVWGLCLCVSVILASGCSPQSQPLPEVGLRQVGRLMGQGMTQTTAGVPWSSDLGVMAFHQGRVFVFTGDTLGSGIFSPNALAWSDDTQAADGLDLHWSVQLDGRPLQFFPRVEPDSTVPAGAVSLNGILYVFMMDVTDWNHDTLEAAHARAMLIRSSDDGGTFQFCWAGPEDNKFVNIAPVIADHPLIPNRQAVYMIGSGRYRQSPVYLAVCDAADIEQPQNYLYFKGLVNDVPQWTASEDQAQPIIDNVMVGELSVQWSGYLNAWLLACFDFNSRNLYFRKAEHPYGPWSEPRLVFDHEKEYDWLETGWGGAYGSYLLRELDGQGGRLVYFILSLWTPYNIFLMEVDLATLFPD